MPPGSEAHGRFERHGGSESGKVEASGAWMAHNPACYNLPHVPCWSLVQGSRMESSYNCHKFYTMSLPSSERFHQKNRDRFWLLDDHVRCGWEFAVGKEKFNKEQKCLNWRVSDAEEKFAKEQKLNAELQEEWTATYARSNYDMKLALDEAMKLKGEKDEASQEVMRLTASLKEKEAQVDTARKTHEEALSNNAELEKAIKTHKAQVKSSEMVSQELGKDCKWLINHEIPLLAKYMFEFVKVAYNSCLKDGYAEGKAFVIDGKPDNDFELFKSDCATHYRNKRKEFGLLEFGF
ncbi:hypothetical protein Hanom_Chr00s000002g01601151 [Helianthus anomalus]